MRSNRRLILAAIFLVLSVVGSGVMVERAQATHCLRCGLCQSEICCKPAFSGGWTECDDSGGGSCVVSGVQCTH